MSLCKQSVRSSQSSCVMADQSQCSSVRVAVTQMTSTENVEHNMQQVTSLVQQAKHKNAKMVFLPEACDFIGRSRQETHELCVAHSTALMHEYKTLAKHNEMWLSLGGLHVMNEEDDGDSRVFNAHVLLDDTGKLVTRYDKLHLFDIDIPGKVRLMESEFSRPGRRLVPPTSTPAGNVALATCYDMRFGQLSAWYRAHGAHILTFPSAFTVPTGQAHWHTLLRARAIETQCYVVAAAQVGDHNDKRSSYGHALVVDGWGAVLADCDTLSPTLAIADLDLQHLQNIRTRLPFSTHVRKDLYCLSSNYGTTEHSEAVYQFGTHAISADNVFYETDHAFAFVNLKPVLPGHVLVASKRVVAALDGLSLSESADLWLCANTVQRVVQAHHKASACTISMQDGPLAGQTVPHVHIHILPRKAHDFGNNDDVYKHLEQHDKDDRPERNTQDMLLEATIYRQLMRAL